MKSYNDTRCPSIGDTVDCTPEVCNFKCGKQLYRLVLTGKRGKRGCKETPVMVLEVSAGKDALGADAWVRYVADDADPDDLLDMLTALFMAMRARSLPPSFWDQLDGPALGGPINE